MFYQKLADVEGNYVNDSGERFSISAVRRVRNPKGVNVGYEEFTSLEDAVRSWNLILFNGLL